MGALFLYKGDNIDVDSVIELFKQKGFTEFKKFGAAGYNILLYPKILTGNYSLIKGDDSFLFATGTFIYKRLGYKKTLEVLLEDLNNGELKEDELLGSFWIFYKKDNKLYFLRDRSGIQNIYYTVDKNVISSSFLACAYSKKDLLSFDKKALVEMLTTGSLIGPDTLFNGIRRLEVNEKPEFEGLEEVDLQKKSFKGFCAGKYENCLDEQIRVLDRYFNSVKDFANEAGVDSGITGGHDSRLIMAMAVKHFSKISFNTHWRSKKNVEFDSAQEVCKAADVNLIVISVNDPAIMTKEGIEQNFGSAFLFFDGLIRMHSFWTEEYNTRQYREKVLGENRLGLSGIGGEQYRNEERMNRSKWDLKNTIKYKILLNNCGDCFKNDEDLNDVIEYIENKIRKGLGLGEKRYISHLEFKRYLNEIFIPARLAVRNNAENQLSFFLSPFTDHNVSSASYNIVNKLGTSFQFEENMIKRMNPKLAAVPSDHGFDFYKGEPLVNKIKSFLIDFIPQPMLYKYYSKRTGNKEAIKLYKDIIKKSSMISDGVDKLKKLNLPIDINKLSLKPDLMPLVLAAGYLIKRLESKIDLTNAV